MRIVVGLLSLVGIAGWSGLLWVGSVMAGMGDGAPPRHSPFDFLAFLPFGYFTFILITCLVRHPTKSWVWASAVAHVSAIPMLLLLFMIHPPLGILLLGYIGLWWLMFRKAYAPDQITRGQLWAGAGLVCLSGATLFFLIYAVFYWQRGSIPDGFIMAAISLVPGICSFLTFRQLRKVRVNNQSEQIPP
ncbi:MAG: hypothetical protein K8R48_00740 [Alphaproteobacteria bacterium]|nr:hypothetical protein [Alphaproteobacteria bacterium]